MLMPSIFGEDMFDEFMRDFPFFDERDERRAERKLYGRRGKNLMKTDVKETEQGYELEMDLPGFTKDEVQVSLENGYLTIQAAKGWIRMSRKRIPVAISAGSGMQEPVSVPSM